MDSTKKFSNTVLAFAVDKLTDDYVATIYEAYQTDI
jgi:hypothetical protein